MENSHKTINGHALPVFSVIYNPDGTNIASGSADNTVKIWNAKDQNS